MTDSQDSSALKSAFDEQMLSEIAERQTLKLLPGAFDEQLVRAFRGLCGEQPQRDDSEADAETDYPAVEYPDSA